jgi:phage/plasmid primase-like uncharacterized protein
VAQTYRGIYPDRAIYIAGDDDRQRTFELDPQGKPKMNVGRVKAEEAAAAIGSQALFPSFPLNAVGSDWNDLNRYQGSEYFQRKFGEAIAIGQREQTVHEMAAEAETPTDQSHGLSKSVGQALGRIGRVFGRDRAALREMEHDQGR